MKRSSTLVFEKRPEDNLTWPELFGARVGVVRKIGLVSVNSNELLNNNLNKYIDEHYFWVYNKGFD